MVMRIVHRHLLCYYTASSSLAAGKLMTHIINVKWYCMPVRLYGYLTENYTTLKFPATATHLTEEGLEFFGLMFIVFSLRL
jgi:hypothetical protein